GAARDLTGPGRAASSILRSSERAQAEARVIENELRTLLVDFRRTGAWERLKCVELIFVLGWPNKDVARRLNLTENAVANHKFFVVQKLREAAKLARVSHELLSSPELD
ncbi:MAG TPA: RNA polymerase subunit sigma-70, partial [Planctomycetaceae bacterium]|nr:RNA polymerase subunit sigma-70 [Planctomycetaceae bacterium]